MRTLRDTWAEADSDKMTSEPHKQQARIVPCNELALFAVAINLTMSAAHCAQKV